MELSPKDIIYSVGILLTFALGTWNLLALRKQKVKRDFIDTVTNQRIKWIEQLRHDLAAFAGLTHTWSASQLEGTEGEIEILKDIDRLRYVIQLRLNPDGTHDRKIAELIRMIPEYTHYSQRDKLDVAMNELLGSSQALIKEEWEKVKDEAKLGDLRDK